MEKFVRGLLLRKSVRIRRSHYLKPQRIFLKKLKYASKDWKII